MPKFGKLKFSESELLNDLETTAWIVRQVGTTHFGLGGRVAFLQAVNLALLGCLQVGTMGIGKTKCLEAMVQMLESALHIRRVSFTRKGKKVGYRKTKGDYNWRVTTREFTMASIDENINEEFTDARITWISKDLAKLSTIVQENMLKVASSLISDHELLVTTTMYGANIHNCDCAWLGACTYEVFNNLMDSSLWRGMYQDRIMRYHSFQYRLANINTDVPSATCRIVLPDELPEVDQDKWFKRIVDMLEMQFTYERSVEYTQRLLQGMAIMNFRDKSVPADAKFILLHEFNIGAESYIAWRRTISAPLVIDTDVLLVLSEAIKRGEVTVPFLASKYHTDESAVMDNATEYPKLLKLTDGGNIIKPTPFVMRFMLAQNNFERWCVSDD